MGIKRLKRLQKEYREAVLADCTNLAILEKELKVEAGNEWLRIKAEVAAEKAKLDAEQTPESALGAGDSPEGTGVARNVSVLEGLPMAAPVDEEPRVMPKGVTIVPTSMCQTHPNDISCLPPCNRWEVCIDESYLGRDKPGVRRGDFYDRDGHGLIAGVVFPSDRPLPPIEQLHCAQEAEGGPKTAEMLEKEEAALDVILRHPTCGVLVLPVSAQKATLGYQDLLVSWTCVMIMMLPLPEGDGEIVVRCHVEPRAGIQTKADFEVYARTCERQLRESVPDRARRVRLECDALPKARRPDEKTWNSYPDVVAHTCQAFGKVASGRFARTGWKGVCYLNEEPEAVARLLHLFFRGEPLKDCAWSVLLKAEASGFARSMLSRVGERCRQDLREWCGYLDETDQHMTSGAVDMRLLKLQVTWLERNFPTSPLPKRIMLSWLTVKLSLANHEGSVTGVMVPGRAEFDAVCADLYEEDIGLVCRAVLNLAVAYTNAYEFEMALAILQPLLERDIASVGRERYGQLLSSAGQHFAFLGETDAAVDRLRRAIACFDALFDAEAKRRNIGITSAYLATVVMDGRPEDAVPALAYYLLGDEQAPVERLVEEAKRLAQVSAESFVDKFKHHIVLRYLVSAEPDDPIRKAYRACGNDGCWSEPGEGHPWELIEFYRAQLVFGDKTKRQAHLERAYQIASKEAGDTVMVIAAVIAGAAMREGVNMSVWKTRLDEACRRIAHLPALWSQGRFQALADQTEEGLSPLDLAKKVLPFNFR